jgi:hypothetical protein
MIAAGQWDHLIPDEVLGIIARLDELGCQTWLVGGCVRDLSLGRDPLDYDLATSARPEVVMAAFPRTFATGLAHGTVTIVFDNLAIEVTTFRSEGPYSDGRRPDNVVFEPDVLPDLSRRDFTINSMAYRPDRGLLDPFGGWEDLQNHRLRCVGQAGQRLREDALRMLRAVRFALTYRLCPDESLLAAIAELKDGIAILSVERITHEIRRMIQAPHGEGLLAFAGSGLLQQAANRLFGCWPDDAVLCDFLAQWIRPNWHKVQAMPLFYLAAAWASQPALDLRCLLRPAAIRPVERLFLQNCKLSREDARQGAAMMAAAGLRILVAGADPLNPVQYNRLLRVLSLTFHLNPADTLACTADGWALLTVVWGQGDFLLPDLVQIRQEQQLAAGDPESWQQPLTVRDLAISGRHPRIAGQLKGPRLGLLLERLLSRVCLDPTANQTEYLLRLAIEWKFIDCPENSCLENNLQDCSLNGP